VEERKQKKSNSKSSSPAAGFERKVPADKDREQGGWSLVTGGMCHGELTSEPH